MKGSIIKIPASGHIEIREVDAPPSLDELQAVVGGDIQEVPQFSIYAPPGAGQWQEAIAYCNEEGKGLGLPINRKATSAWNDALINGHGYSLFGPDGNLLDILVGDVVVLTGDPEFLESL